MDFLKKLSKIKIAIIAGTSLATLAVLSILIFGLAKPMMVPLFGELSQEDTSLVISKLEAMGKQYTTDKKGHTIMVAIADVLPVRMQLAQDGIPNQSKILGYEIFDKNDIIGSSQFVNNINELRALEGELMRTINSLSEIEQSRVHLVLPKSDFFSKTGPISSAAVFLKVKNGKKLNDSQINGISNLIAAAVPGLSVENIAITDQNGKALKTPGAYASADGAKSMDDYKTNIENKLKQSVESIVEKYVGVGKVQANIIAEIDFDKIVISQEEYNPNAQVERSHRTSDETSNDTEMDKNVSVATNIPNFLQKPQPNSLKEHKKHDEIINYEISKTVTNRVLQWGGIKRLSVAVLVDGVYDQDKNTHQDIYLRDRNPEELLKIKQLVSASIGLDKNRGDTVEVMNLPFASNKMFDDISEPETPQYDIATIIQLMIVLIIIIIAAIMLLKPNLIKIFNKNTNNTMSDNDMPQQLKDKLFINEQQNNSGSNTVPSIDQPFSEKQYEKLLNYVNESAEENIEHTLKILRQWLQSSNQ